jgi:diacylglycerol kinase
MNFRLVRPDLAEPIPAHSPRTWRAKFREACQGIKLGVRGQSSFFGHFFAATLVIVAAVTLQCDLTEWCLLVGCIGLVMTAELVNSAIETVFRGLDAAARDKNVAALHIAAGAVLMASGTAAIIGLIILGKKLWTYFAPML